MTAASFEVIAGSIESSVILHVPHSSRFIPEEVRKDLLLTEDKLAKEIFMIWKSSIEHNKAMTDPAAKFAGCSVVATESPGNTKEWKHYNTISIMVLTN